MSQSFATTLVRTALVLMAGLVSALPVARAQLMVVADQNIAPGKLQSVRGGRLEYFFERWTRFDDSPVQNRIASIAIDHGHHYFYCSGLDSAVFEYNGRDEFLLTEAREQVRHVAFDRANNLVYFSTLATPQDGAPLADGTICAYSLAARRVTKTFRVSQAALAGPFWGAFAVNAGGELYIATDSAVYHSDRGGWRQVYRVGGDPIRGLAFSPWGQLHYVDGSKDLYAFQKDGSAQKLMTLATSALTHVGWFKDSGTTSSEGGTSKPGIRIPARPLPLPGPSVPGLGIKPGDFGGRPLATSSIQGNVLGLSAAQVSRVRVSIVSPQGFARSMMVNGKGYFLFKDLPAGDYTVSVRADGPAITFKSSRQNVQLADNTSQQVLFEVQPVRVRVR